MIMPIFHQRALIWRKMGKQKNTHPEHGHGLEQICRVSRGLVTYIKEGLWLTALQKNVRYALPISDRAAKTKPNSPRVARRAMFSTSVTALSASARCDLGHISVMTPLAAGADPEPKGRIKAAEQSQVTSVCALVARRRLI